MYCECPEPDEYWYDIETKMVTARKDHGCHECGKSIGKGDQYERLTGFTSSEGPVVFKTCAFCAHVRSDLDSYGFCTLYGSLWDDIATGEEEAADQLAWEKRRKELFFNE